MARQTRQEKAISALLETGTIKEASEVSGVPQSTIFRWVRIPILDKDMGRQGEDK